MMNDWRPPQQETANGIRALPPMVHATSLLSCGTSVLLLASGLRDAPRSSPPALLLGLGVCAALVGLYAMWRGSAFGRYEAAALVVACEVGICLLSSVTNDPIGMLSNGGAFVILGMYMAWYLSDWWARILLWTGAIAYCIIAVVRDLPGVDFVAVATCLQAVIVTEVMVRMRSRLTHLATVDPLTGALNRWALHEIGQRAVAQAHRTGDDLSLVGIDLDGLKAVNDEQGHLAGDRLLRSVVVDWSRHLRRQDALVRSGGDEFIVLLPGCSPEGAAGVVARMRADSTVSWSAGIASLGPDDTLETLVARADTRQLRDKVERRGEGDSRDRRGFQAPYEKGA